MNTVDIHPAAPGQVRVTIRSEGERDPSRHHHHRRTPSQTRRARGHTRDASRVTHIPATHNRKITGHDQAVADWVRDHLGIEPSLVNRVVITLDVHEAVTADVRMYVTEEMVDQLDADLAAQPAVTDGIATCLLCDEDVRLTEIAAHIASHHKPTPRRSGRPPSA